MEERKTTTVELFVETKQLLDSFGKFGETRPQLIERVLNEYEEMKLDKIIDDKKGR
ncbi:hypothetical protein KKC87_04565 [Patescibacteria group bacterium]|nr:hypothetical protein [Patescibacteria group bacterium]